MEQLTDKQESVYEFCREREDGGRFPTYREVMDHFDYASPNSVTQNITALARKGFIRRLGESWTTYVDTCPHCGQPV